MWDIQHPNKVFEYIVDKSKNNFIRLLLKKDKYLSFDLSIRNSLETKGSVKEVKICNPNNPACLMDCCLLELFF
jgi:histidinol-phosphate/aromatic aminotransferase/cobyric acid decarboxylase-like protein